MVLFTSGTPHYRENVVDRAHLKVGLILVVMLMLCVALRTTAGEADTLRSRPWDWYASLGGTKSDVGYDILRTDDGGFLISGVTNSFGAGFCDVYVVKIDSLSKLQWERTYGGERSDYGFAVCDVDGGGYVIVGSTWSFGRGEADAYLLRIDEKGNDIWTRTFGGPYYERASDVQQTADGGFIIVGWTTSFGAGGIDIFALKIDKNGIEQWRRMYGGNADDFGYSVSLAGDGGFIFSGSTLSFGSNRADAYVVRTDGEGEVKWSKRYGGDMDEYGRSIIQTTDRGFLLAGYSSSFGNGGADAYFVRMDSIGDTLWTRVYGGEGTDGCASVVSTIHRGFAATGWTNSFGGGEFDIYFVEMDSLGDLVRTWTFGWQSREKSHGLVSLGNGGFVITGFSFSFESADADLLVVKLLSEEQE